MSIIYRFFFILIFTTFGLIVPNVNAATSLFNADTSAAKPSTQQKNNKSKYLKLKTDFALGRSSNNFSLKYHSPSFEYEPITTAFVKKSLNTVKKVKANYPVEYQMVDGTYWREESNVNPARFATLAGVMITLDLAAYFYQRKVWDQENTTKMHSINWWIDVHNYQRMDKLGHFTDAYFVSDLTSKLYRWSGFAGETSVWMGAATGWLWMFEIEISDAFFADWGFSWLDLSANTIGAGFFVLQHYFPEILGGLHPKFSYQVSYEWKNGLYYKMPKSFIDDYEGMTFWMAINPYHYFPDSWKRGYPKWLAPLGIAIGYGAEEIGLYPQAGRPQWYVGLDIDLRRLDFGDESGFFKFLKSELNFIRLPLPTIRITPSGIWYGLYF